MKKTIINLLAFTVGIVASFATHAKEMAYRAITGYMGNMGLVLYAVPTMDDFLARRVTNPNQSEVIRQRLYDWQLYPTAGQGQFSFFSQQVGTGVTTALGAAVGSTKTQADTNIELAGQLPSGKQELVESIEIVFLPGSSAAANTYTPAVPSLFAAAAAAAVAAQLNDVNSFYQSGFLEFNVLSKNYLREAPLLSFPPKAQFNLDAAVANTSATVGEIATVTMRAAGRPYYLEPTVSIQSAVNFEVLLKFPGPVATPSGFNARIGCYLDGYQMRASQ